MHKELFIFYHIIIKIQIIKELNKTDSQTLSMKPIALIIGQRK